MRLLLAAAAVLALSAGSTFATPNCTPGKSYLCGKSCISNDKQCKVDPSAKPSTAAAPAKPATAAAPATKSTAPAKGTKCKDASGKYAKCGSPGAKPA